MIFPKPKARPKLQRCAQGPCRRGPAADVWPSSTPWPQETGGKQCSLPGIPTPLSSSGLSLHPTWDLACPSLPQEQSAGGSISGLWAWPAEHFPLLPLAGLARWSRPCGSPHSHLARGLAGRKGRRRGSVRSQSQSSDSEQARSSRPTKQHMLWDGTKEGGRPFQPTPTLTCLTGLALHWCNPPPYWTESPGEAETDRPRLQLDLRRPALPSKAGAQRILSEEISI